MKRKLSYCLCLWAWAFALPLTAHPVDWITANQVTLVWQEVTTLTDGSPVPPGDLVSYEVFIVPETGDKVNDRVSKGEVAEPEAVITFDQEGKFYLGLWAIRSSSGENISYSDVVWTDNPAVMKNGIAHGIVFFKGLSKPLVLEIK